MPVRFLLCLPEGVIRLSIELLIQNGSTIYYPVVEEGVSLTWERKGTPGRLDLT